jgi:hypothetical protein
MIDLTEVFAASDDPLSLFPNRTLAHYSPEGYALVAQHIDQWLDEN